MKKRIVLLIALILIFFFFIAVQYYFLKKKAEIGKIKIWANPKSKVLIDNQTVGKTPFETDLKIGQYIVSLMPEKTSSKTVRFTTKVTIHQNALTFLSREFGESEKTSTAMTFQIVPMESKPQKPHTGDIDVQSDPKGALVYLDGQEQEITPLRLTNIEPRTHELSIYLNGYSRRSQKVKVEENYRVLAYFKLAASSSQYNEQKNIQEATTSSKLEKKQTRIRINETPTGWLRVRQEPTLTSSESARVYPQNEFSFVEESGDWYKIEYEKGKFGWVSKQYTTLH